MESQECGKCIKTGKKPWEYYDFFESTCFTDFTSSQYCKAPGGVASQSFFDLERLKELEQMV